jgi:6-pyruvoyltetrahydropterin/6-carboxytetrahydropterin synthase
MWEISKSFGFEAAHTLRRDIATESSKRIHGHSYKAEVTVAGKPDPATGMVIDIGELENHLANLRVALDHHFLDEIADLGPATMENIAAWIWRRLAGQVLGLVRVVVSRESCGERCTYTG